jgi:hypothetical protein
LKFESHALDQPPFAFEIAQKAIAVLNKLSQNDIQSDVPLDSKKFSEQSEDLRNSLHRSLMTLSEKLSNLSSSLTELPNSSKPTDSLKGLIPKIVMASSRNEPLPY